MKIRTAVLATALVLSAGLASADTYLRKGSEEVDVRVTDGKLYCTRTSDQFEMCHGMTKQADGTWRGNSMKHPMFSIMKFKGTVTFKEAGLNIKGCAIGICKAEDWVKK